MICNGTILGVSSIRTSLLSAAALLSILFTVMKPEASLGLDLFARFVFWVLHVGVAVGSVLLASIILRSVSIIAKPVLLAIVVIGFLGAALAAPFYVVLERLFPVSDSYEWLDTIADRGIIFEIFVEYIEVLPVFMTGWIVINVPLLLRKPHINESDYPEGGDNRETKEEIEKRLKLEKSRIEFIAALPDIIGDDIVAICSDLHYLNVHTVLGKALVLGSLKRCVDLFEDTGMQIHRSNWVAKEHVVRVVIKGNEAYCLMTNGLKVPISRSKRKEVKSFFGQSSLLASCLEGGHVAPSQKEKGAANIKH